MSFGGCGDYALGPLPDEAKRPSDLPRGARGKCRLGGVGQPGSLNGSVSRPEET
jgi:hypothetical protein